MIPDTIRYSTPCRRILQVKPAFFAFPAKQVAPGDILFYTDMKTTDRRNLPAQMRKEPLMLSQKLYSTIEDAIAACEK